MSKKNANDVRAVLAETLEDLINGEVSVPVAKETANVAGKMISSARAQVEYYHRSAKTMPTIEFLEEPEK